MPSAEARRIVTLCNVCKYCNGYCEMFRAAERRREFSHAGLTYLANLCHDCRNCRSACQYAPPHPFAVNVPGTLAELRERSYRHYSWPVPVYHAGWAAFSVAALVPALALFAIPWDILSGSHLGPGAFYAVIPREALFLATFLAGGWPVLALTIGLVRFWRDTGGGNALTAIPAAMPGILGLRNLAGGGAGCNGAGGALSQARRRFHHALFYGFVLCFASTAFAAVFHHGLGWQAPYSRTSLPVLLGSAGGAAMVVGTSGLAWIKMKADPAHDAERTGYSLLVLFFAVAATGLACMVLRESPAMGMLLAIHLGTVLGFLFTVPYGKFVHGPYRAAALLRAALERQISS